VGRKFGSKNKVTVARIKPMTAATLKTSVFNAIQGIENGTTDTQTANAIASGVRTIVGVVKTEMAMRKQLGKTTGTKTLNNFLN